MSATYYSDTEYTLCLRGGDICLVTQAGYFYLTAHQALAIGNAAIKAANDYIATEAQELPPPMTRCRICNNLHNLPTETCSLGCYYKFRRHEP